MGQLPSTRGDRPGALGTAVTVSADHESVTLVVEERSWLRGLVRLASLGVIVFGVGVAAWSGLVFLTSPVVVALVAVPVLVGVAGLWTGDREVPARAMVGVALLGAVCAAVLGGLSLLVDSPMQRVEGFGALSTGLVALALALRGRVALRKIVLTTRELTVVRNGSTLSAPLEEIALLRLRGQDIEIGVTGRGIERFGRVLDQATREEFLERIEEARTRWISTMTEERLPPAALTALTEHETVR